MRADSRDIRISTINGQLMQWATHQCRVVLPLAHRATIIGYMLVLLSTPAASTAWGPLAHAVIGHLAESQLQQDDLALNELLTKFRHPQQRRKVQRALLGMAPPAPDNALRRLANWPDRKKRQSGMLPYDGQRHYVNLSPWARYQRSRHCPHGVCSIETLLQQRAILGDRRRSLSKRAVALAWVVHLVGDIHQPLHAGSVTDRGGNLACVIWQGRPSKLVMVDGKKQCSGANLHELWDSKIIRQTTGFYRPGDAIRYARTLQHFMPTVRQAEPPITASTPAAWRTVVEQWHGETQALLLSHHIYPSGKTIDRSYVQTHYPTIRLQLLRAAVRLTALLQRTLHHAP